MLSIACLPLLLIKINQKLSILPVCLNSRPYAKQMIVNKQKWRLVAEYSGKKNSTGSSGCHAHAVLHPFRRLFWSKERK